MTRSLVLLPEMHRNLCEILSGTDRVRFLAALQYALGEDYECRKVLQATSTSIVCLVHDTQDGRVLRAQMDFEPKVPRVKAITLWESV